jgi:hypothetical protein
MSKRIGKWTKFWVEGYALTTLLTAINPDTQYDTIDVGGFTQDKYYLAARGDSSLGIEGFFSDTAGETHTALSGIASGTAASVVTVAIGNNATPTVGDPSISMTAQQLDYVGTPNLNEAVAVSANFKTGLDQVLDYGVLLCDATITANGNQSSVDQSTSSAAGGVGYFHITALSAGDTITINIQDSADDAAWADLITCTLDGTAVDGERVTVAGTVNRYVRAEYVVTGSGVSFPIAVAFKRY